MPNITLPRADIPIDSAGNIASRDLYRWMSDITDRVGGSTGSVSDASETFEDAGIEETKAQLYAFEASVAQSPAVQELMWIAEEQSGQIVQLASLVAELLKRLDGVEQETLQ
jgi:hypothetical protein